MRAALLVLVTATAFAAACDSPTDAGRFADTENLQYYPGLNVDLARMTRTDSGLYYEDLAEGSGPAIQQGDSIAVHYSGWLPDGTLFDSSRNRAPMAYRHGVTPMIDGFDEAVDGQQAGARRRVVIPPHLAYGTQRRGQIPPNSTLVFDIEIIELR